MTEFLRNADMNDVKMLIDLHKSWEMYCKFNSFETSISPDLVNCASIEVYDPEGKDVRLRR